MIPKREHSDDSGPQFGDKLPRPLRHGNGVLNPARMVVWQECGLELGLRNSRNDGLGAPRLEPSGERGRCFFKLNTAQHESLV